MATQLAYVREFSGAAAALLAGLTLGAAMQPSLGFVDRPQGPQMFAAWSGERSTGPFDPGTSFTAYNGRVPDYVIGTDWARPKLTPDDRAYAVQADYSRDEPAMERPTTPPAASAEAEPQRQPISYPSVSGGQPYGADIPTPPAPPSDTVAAPAVTG